MGTPLNKKEVETIKLLLAKGLETTDITAITGKSRATIKRVEKDERDYLINGIKKIVDVRKVEPVKEDKTELAKVYNLIWNALVILEKLGGQNE